MADINIKFAVLYIVQIFVIASSTQPVIIKSEGERVAFLFSYDYSKDYVYKVTFNDLTSFDEYQNLNKSNLTNSKRESFSVHENIYDHLVQLTVDIRNVSRVDAGSYKCSVFQNGTLVEDLSKEIHLMVLYPPGKAQCVQVSPSLQVHPGLEREYTIIDCRAIRGNVQGYISCYQQDRLALPFSDLHLNHTLMVQKVWMKTTLPITCCSTTKPMDLRPSNCRDVTIDMATKVKPTSQPNTHTSTPCSAVDKTAPTIDTTPPLEKWKYNYTNGFFSYISIGDIFIICILGVHIYRFHRLRRPSNNQGNSGISTQEAKLDSFRCCNRQIGEVDPKGTLSAIYKRPDDGINTQEKNACIPNGGEDSRGTNSFKVVINEDGSSVYRRIDSMYSICDEEEFQETHSVVDLSENDSLHSIGEVVCDEEDSQGTSSDNSERKVDDDFDYFLMQHYPTS